MNYALRLILCLVLLCLAACAGSKPRYLAGSCPPQWQIPVQYKQPLDLEQAIQDLQTSLKNLTQALSESSPSVSAPAPIAPLSSALNPK